MAAWRNLHRFEAGLPFLPWARRIALNKVRDDARRRSVRRMLLGEAPDALVRNIADPAPLPEAQAIDREALVRLDRAIAALPLALRGPLVLTAIEGLSHAEAGAELGISAKAVETKVARARRELREILGVA